MKRQHEIVLPNFTHLPDLVLHNVLNRLSTKHAVQLSILSKNMNESWKSLSNLTFDSREFHSLVNFYNFVSEVLSKRDSSIPLNSFHYKCPSRKSISGVLSFINWIFRYAVNHNVKHLSIELFLDFFPRNGFPPIVFRSQTLTCLKLVNTFQAPKMELPTSLECPSLEILHLKYATFVASANEIANPFSSLPRLTKLVLEHCAVHFKVKVLSIHNVNLSVLTIHDAYHFDVTQRISLSIPNIRIMTLCSKSLEIIVKELSNSAHPPSFVRLDFLKVIKQHMHGDELNGIVGLLIQNSARARVHFTERYTPE